MVIIIRLFKRFHSILLLLTVKLMCKIGWNNHLLWLFVYLSSSLKITMSLQRVYAVCFIVKTEDQQQHLVFRLFTSTLSYSGMSGSFVFLFSSGGPHSGGCPRQRRPCPASGLCPASLLPPTRSRSPNARQQTANSRL